MPQRKALNRSGAGRKPQTDLGEASSSASRPESNHSSELSDLRTAAAILKTNNIAYSRLDRCLDSHTNRVFLADASYLVRFSSDPTGPHRMMAESRLVASLRGVVPTREVLSFGVLDGNAYQILSYIEGVDLADCWPSMSRVEKERVVAELVDNLLALHEIRFAEFGYLCLPGASYQAYRDFRISEFDAVLNGIEKAPCIRLPISVLEPYRQFFHEQSVCFADSGEARLIHNDFWPGNVVIHNGKVAGIIDFELATKAPLVLELMKLEWFCDRPGDFFKTGDYGDFMGIFRQHYEEIFRASADIRMMSSLHKLHSIWNSYLFEVQAGLADPARCPHHLIRMSDNLIRANDEGL